MAFPSVVASLLLASPDVAVVYCAAVAPPPVAIVLSAVNVMLWSLMLPAFLLFFPTVMLLFAFPSFPAVSYAAVRPAVNVSFPPLFLSWIPCDG
jgi:hypothetical protein